MLGFNFSTAGSGYTIPFLPITEKMQQQALVFCKDIEAILSSSNKNDFKEIEKAINTQLEKIKKYFSSQGKTLNENEAKILTEIALCYFQAEGPLRYLLYDPQLEEICCNGLGPENPVFVFSRQTRSFLPTNLYFTDFDSLRTLINNLTALHAGRRMDLKNPYVMALVELNNQKFRFTAVQERATSTSPIQFAIRKYTTNIYTPCDLINLQTLDAKTAALFWLIFQLGQRINLLVVGRPASGKTTFLQAMTLFIPDDQRIIDAEYQPELRFLQKNVAGLMSRPEEGLTMARLIEVCERYRPDRFIVGEVVARDEILSLLDVVGRATGDGIYATYHATSAKSTLQTIYLNVRDKASPLDLVHIRLIATVWPLRYLKDGKEIFERRLVEIAEITDQLAGELPKIQTITQLQDFKYSWPKVNSSWIFDQLKTYFGSEKKLQQEWDLRTKVLEALSQKKPDAPTFYRFVQNFTKDPEFREKTMREMGL